jgi:hypothetical protein
LSSDGQRWISPRKKKFFLPVKPLGRLFRGRFLAYLREAFAEGRLEFYGQLPELAHKARFDDWAESLQHKEWVVYACSVFWRGTPIERRFPMGDCSICRTAAYVFAGWTRQTTIRSRKCLWMRWSSFGAFSSMGFLAAL